MSKNTSGNKTDLLVATLKWVIKSGSKKKTANKSPKETSTDREEQKPAWKGPIPLFSKKKTQF
jgi:hypothetical protein